MVQRGSKNVESIKKGSQEIKRIFRELCAVASWELFEAVKTIGHTKQIYSDEELE